MSELTHFDAYGNAIMVDVTEKNITTREAVATGKIIVCKEIYNHIVDGSVAKGDVLGVARIAGIMGSKKTSELIPLCHPLPLTKCSIDFELDGKEFYIAVTCTVKTDSKTGVEMEALTGVQIALLTIYDMCKAIDKHMIITDIHLKSKSGGKSGCFKF